MKDLNRTGATAGELIDYLQTLRSDHLVLLHVIIGGVDTDAAEILRERGSVSLLLPVEVLGEGLAADLYASDIPTEGGDGG